MSDVSPPSISSASEPTLGSGFSGLLRAPMIVRRFSVPYGAVAALLLALLGLGLALSRSPLTGVLGYETSAITGLVIAFLLPWGFAHRLAELRASVAEAPDPWPIRAETLAAGWLLSGLSLAMIPGLCLLLAAMLQPVAPRLLMRNCDLSEGVAWYLGIVTATVILTFGMSALMATLTARGRTIGWLTIVWVMGSLILVTGHWLLGPRVAFLHPIVGAIVLPNYSPVVRQDVAYWISRIIAMHWGILGWTVFLLAFDPVVRWHRLAHVWRWDGSSSWRGIRVVHLGLIVLGLGMTWWYRGPLGLATPMSWLVRELPGLKQTAHFQIHYAPESAVAAQIEDLALLSEFHYAAIEEAFQLQEPVMIQMWLYPTPADKERLTGARGSVFAKPWINSTHVFATGTDVSALRHELTHIMGREFGPPPTYVNMLAGIAEGTSEAIAWDAGPDLTFHQWAKGGQELKLAEDVQIAMSNPGFFSGRIQLNYATSGSFMRWLIDTYGIEKFRQLFRGYNPFIPGAAHQWERYYGKSWDALASEWHAYLESEVEFTERDRETVQFTYEQPAFINQACARDVAAAQERAQLATSVGLWDTAIREYDTLWAFQPGNLYHRFGKLDVLIQAERYDEAIALYGEMLEAKNLNRGLESRLHGVRGDIALRQGDWEAAKAAMDQALKLAVFSWQDRDGSIKRAVLDLPVSARGPMVTGLTGRPELALYHFARAEVELPWVSWIPSYLHGRRLSFAGEYEAAMEAHTRFLTSDGMLDALHDGTDLTGEDPAIPEAVLREGLLVALHDAVWSHDLRAAEALEAWLDAGSQTVSGAVAWTPADLTRIALYREFATYQRGHSTPVAPASVAGLWWAALSPPEPVTPLGVETPDRGLPLVPSQSDRDPARE